MSVLLRKTDMFQILRKVYCTTVFKYATLRIVLWSSYNNSELINIANKHQIID